MTGIKAYTPDSRWQSRSEFINRRSGIVAFLTRKWTTEPDYRLIAELRAFDGNRIAVRFAHEWHDDSGGWFRSYGNENWEFDEAGLMRLSLASINDQPIAALEPRYHWALGRRRMITPDSATLASEQAAEASSHLWIPI